MAVSKADRLLAILKDDLKPALGVTEPLAVALAAARAYQAIGGQLVHIELTTSPALYKTGISCVIAGTDHTGFAMAAILGAIAGKPQRELELLEGIDSQTLIEAEALLERDIVDVVVKDAEPAIYVKAAVTTSEGFATAVLKESHTGVVLVEANGEVVYSAADMPRTTSKNRIEDYDVTQLIEFVRDSSSDSLAFVLNAAAMNRKLAQAGLSGAFGMRVGFEMRRNAGKDVARHDPVTWAGILVAAACDARLGGAKLPAMSVAGSGSHGITASLPIAAVADHRDIKAARTIKPLALSFLLTKYIKAYAGTLSAFCGCAVTAAVGASAGIVALLDGSDGQIVDAISNMAADVTGIICDGANFGCALKTSSGASSAVRAALLALSGTVIPSGSGIVGAGVEETIRNIAMISDPGMIETDQVILQMIRQRTPSDGMSQS